MHDEIDGCSTGTSTGLVGYKKPPAAHRFQKGSSGNPRGRPKKNISKPEAKRSVQDVENLMLEEAYRLVSVREGDSVIQMPTIQAVMRGLAVAAMKGNYRAQVTFKEHTQAIESKRLTQKQQLFEAAAEYKWSWEREFERCDQLGEARPNPVPHPGDIQLDVREGEARFVGPQDDLQKAAWDQMQDRKQSAQQEINELRQLMKQKPKYRQILEEEIAFEQHRIELIDYYLPDEATRRRPTYNPDKRGKPPERFKSVRLAKPAAGAKGAAAGRDQADPAG